VALHVRPLTLKQANELVSQWHRHHKAVTGHRFSIGVYDEAGVCHGAAIVGRPVSRFIPPYDVAEVARLVTDGTYNACSMLYAACARAAKAMGFLYIQTYILESEPGTSLKASGWTLDGVTEARFRWGSHKRARTDPPVIQQQSEQRWVLILNARKHRRTVRQHVS
jgi:hypothetical protein